MYILSGPMRSEFLAVPELVRVSVDRSSGEPRAVVIIKSTTLLLKYLLKLRSFRFIFQPTSAGYLVYGIEVTDDPSHPATIWSFLEQEAEREGLAALFRNSKFDVFLFNEAVVNVAQSQCILSATDGAHAITIQATKLKPESEKILTDELGNLMDQLQRGTSLLGGGKAEIAGPILWEKIKSTYVTNRLELSSLSIFDQDEGG